MTTLSFDVLWRDRGASKGMQDLGKHTQRTSERFGVLKQAAGNALADVAKAAIKFGGSSVKAYVDAQTSQVKLQDAYRKFPKLADTNISSLRALNTQLAKKTKFDDDATASGQAVLAQFKLTGKQITELTPLMQDYAAKTGKSLPAAATTLGRALMGNARALKAVGINIPPVADATKVLAAAQKSVTTTSDNLRNAQQRLADLQAVQASKTTHTVSDQIALRRAQDAVREATVRHEGALGNLQKAQDGAKKGTSSYSDVVKGLRRQVGGFAEKEGKSAAGQAAILKNQFGELQESAGKQLLPALLKVGGGLLKVVGLIQDNSAVFGTLGKTIKIVFSSIAESVSGSKASFKSFSDFVATHQADITSAIISGGKAFIGFAKVVLTVASGALRAFGGLSDGINHVVSFIINQYAALATGAATAFGWIPGIGPKMVIAAARFRVFAAHAAADIGKTGDSARGLADGIDNKLLPGLNKAGTGLDNMGKKAISAARARDITAKAEIRHRDALDAATRAAKTNGKTLDSNTVSGRANRTALNNLVASSRNYISKLDATGASSKKVTQATQTARAEFIRVAQKMGLSSAAAKDLAAKYFKLPKKVEIKHSTPGGSAARNTVQGVASDIKKVNGKKVTVGITVNTSLNALNRAIVKQYGKFAWKAGFAPGGVLPGFTPGRDVHRFFSPTGGQLDLSGGEAVMRPEWTKAVGGPKAVAKMNAEARSGQLSAGFAGGGVVSRNMVAAVAMHGRAIDYTKLRDRASRDSLSAASSMTRETGLQATRDAMNAAIKAAKARQSAAMAGAGGGPIGKGGYASALAYARRHRGHPYIFGTLWDCSGFMSALHSIILGQRPHRRYSTTAFHGAHAAGFTRGKSSPFRVGVRPLAGRFGHMAGTLNGVNVESSGGVGVRVGGGARGAGSGMFSWRGGLAKGGVIGDMPFDLLDPQGERYQPWLADLVHKAGYHRGGRIGGDGPERILSAPQNRAFEHLVRVMDRRSGGGAGNTTVIVNAPNYIGSRSELKQTLVTMARSGDFDAVLARAGRG